MLSTRFTELVGCSVPIQQAGMGAGSPPSLVAAVCEAGGLGMIGNGQPGGRTRAGVAMLIEQTQTLTDKPFGVNFLIPPHALEDIDPACFEIASRAARVVEFFFGWPIADLVKAAHDGGAVVSWQVGSLEEARAAVDAGCDIVVAQGVAAGGHVRGTIGWLALLNEIRAANLGAVVLAAGGIGSGRDLAAALAAGADGVRMGTRFIAAAEGNAHPTYQQKLVAARAEDTVYTDAFKVGWDAPHRLLRSSIEVAAALTEDVIGDRPSLDGSRVPIQRFSPGVATRETTGQIEAMPLWAGESVGSVKRIQPAAEIIAEVIAEASAALHSGLTTA